jgi:hypothetical protein
MGIQNESTGHEMGIQNESTGHEMGIQNDSTRQEMGIQNESTRHEMGIHNESTRHEMNFVRLPNMDDGGRQQAKLKTTEAPEFHRTHHHQPVSTTNPPCMDCVP